MGGGKVDQNLIIDPPWICCHGTCSLDYRLHNGDQGTSMGSMELSFKSPIDSDKYICESSYCWKMA